MRGDVLGNIRQREGCTQAVSVRLDQLHLLPFVPYKQEVGGSIPSPPLRKYLETSLCRFQIGDELGPSQVFPRSHALVFSHLARKGGVAMLTVYP